MSFNIDGNGIQTGNSLFYKAELVTDSTYNLPVIPIGTAAVFYGSVKSSSSTTFKTPTAGSYAIIRCTAVSGKRLSDYQYYFETQNCTHFFPGSLSANTTIDSLTAGSRSGAYIVVFYWRVA